MAVAASSIHTISPPATEKWFKPVVVHEFGHSFAGLADEYAYEQEQIPMYPHDVEPWEKNITTLADFHGKWENMIDKKTKIPTPLSKKEKEAVSKVGVFEGAWIQLEGRLPRCAGLPYAHQRNAGILPGMQEGAAGPHRLLHEIKKS